MSHSRAVFLMVLVTLMWSIAGVVTRHLQGAESFEVTFWRSGFTALAALATLPLAWPLRTSAHDLSLLALLGVVQLAIPCLLAVWLTRVLPGPEIALLALLEVIFGVTWAWLGAGEAPGSSALVGGALV